MIRGEALLVAVLATVLGLLAGVGSAAATVAVLGRSSAVSVALPFTQLAGIVLLAVLTGFAAAALPARRAARLDVLTAIAAD